jgi:DNA polymerase III subunit beta
MLNPTSADFSITLKTAHILAAAELSAKKNIRSYLNGVCIDGLGPQVLTVCTDGAVVGIVCTGVDVTEKFAFIIPNAQLDILKKSGGVYAVFTYTGARHDGQGQWKMESLGISSTWATEGIYPDFRRIMPGETSGEAAQYDPDLIQKFMKARKALKLSSKAAHKLSIAYNGAGPGLASFPEYSGFIGAVMPLRVKEEFTKIAPNWSRFKE